MTVSTDCICFDVFRSASAFNYKPELPSICLRQQPSKANKFNATGSNASGILSIRCRGSVGLRSGPTNGAVITEKKLVFGPPTLNSRTNSTIVECIPIINEHRNSRPRYLQILLLETDAYE